MPTTDDVLDAAGNVAYAAQQLAVSSKALFNVLLAWHDRPRSIAILVNGKEGNGMPTPVNDVSFFVHAMGRDAAGVLAPLNTSDATAWAVFEADGTTPSTKATTAADTNHAGDNSYQMVSVTPTTDGTLQGPFKLQLTDSTLSLTGMSDQLDPTAGAPTALDIEMSTT